LHLGTEVPEKVTSCNEPVRFVPFFSPAGLSLVHQQDALSVYAFPNQAFL